MSSETGQRVGDYEVLALLGSGGMGRVYKVRNVISNREEAMKILLPDFAAEPELAARFMSEIRTLAGLEHPNIAQLRTAFKVQNHFVMVMEYVEGVGLDKLAPQSTDSLDTLLDYAQQVLAALSYAHGQGVTHRDIKPANIMITSHGVVKLMDFGIAKSTTNDNLTRPGTTMGSIYYMSPEQVRGSTVDARSDIYSFGVTLYEMLTGKKPFEADTSYSVLNAQLNEAPVPPLQLNPSLPPQLNTIVLRAMEKRPEDRFQTADEFRNALRTVREPQAAQAIPQPQPSVQTVPYSATQSFGQAVPQPAPQQVPQQGFTPVSVPVAAAQNSRKSHRTFLWMGLGAAAVVVVLVALAAVLPRFYATHAGQNSNSATGTQVVAVAPEPANTSSSAMASVAPPQTSAAVPQSNSPVAPAPTTSASAAQTNGGSHANPPSAVAASAAAGSGNRPAPAVSQPAAQPGPAPAAAAAAPPAPSGPSPQEIRQARDRFTDLNARAQSAAAGVQQLRAQQQAQGLDIRGDILTAMNRMNSDMAAANQSLGQKDLDAAADYMNRADKEISTLEKFQGR